MIENENSPLVTVAMVTYNSSQYVRMAIESVLASSYTNFELIISDDCSTDNTWEIVNEYKDKRIRAFRNETNIGEYPNRNLCLNMTKGEYLIYVDGDDYIYPHALDFMTKMLHEFKECAMTMVNGAFNNVILPYIITPKEFYLAHFLGKSFLSSSLLNTMFRVKILTEMGGLLTQYATGDNFIRLKIAAKHPVLLINDGFTWWRETPGQATQKVLNNPLISLEQFKYQIDFLRNKECPLNSKEKKIATTIINSMIYRILIKQLLRLKFQILSKISNDFKIYFWQINLYKKPKRNYKRLSAYTPTLPYNDLINRNPFRKNSIK